MFGLRARLSVGQKLWLGFAWCPFVTWVCVGAQIFLVIGIDSAFPRFFPHPSAPAVIFMVLSWCAFWCCVAEFSGFGAAFFWDEVVPRSRQEINFAFWTVALAWSPTLVLGCAWFLLLLPFVLFMLLLPFVWFMAMYHDGLVYGRRFWESSSPREWMGDFSGGDGASKGP